MSTGIGREHAAGPLLERLRAGALRDRITAGIVGGIPAFANAEPAYQQLVDAVVGRILDTATTLIAEQRNATRAELSGLVEQCLPPTERGITLEDMLDVFRAAAAALWGTLHEEVEAGSLSDPADVLDVTGRGIRLLADLTHGVTVRYLEGNRTWLHRADAERVLVAGLLGTPPAVEQATRAAQSLGIRLHDTWRCAVYVPRRAGLDPVPARRAVDEARRGAAVRRLGPVDAARTTRGERLSSPDGTGALAVFDGQLVLALPAGRVPPSPPDGWVLGVGRALDGTQGLRTSYDEARDAAQIAVRRGLVALQADDARLDRLFLGSLSAGELGARVLAPIDDEPEPRAEMLLATLEAWLDHGGSVTAAARALDLHPQSLRYRLDRLRAVLADVDLDDPEQRLELHVAVKARRLA